MSVIIRLGLVYGGRSGEHEVSIRSAQSIYAALDQSKYQITLILIDAAGQWQIQTETEFLSLATIPVKHLGSQADATNQLEQGFKLLTTDLRQQDIELIFPIVHGTFGEDGSLQGLLEMLDMAYVGSGVVGSAVGMDKEIMKRLLREAGLPIGKFQVIRQQDMDAIRAGDKKLLQTVETDLSYPIFVKPASLGSSVGVSKAHNQSELVKAIEEALQYDSKVLCEAFIAGREVECAVLGNAKPQASVVGEISPTHEFYDYEAKYLDEHGAVLQIPAHISPATQFRIQALALQVFATLQCQGLSRVDFFLQDDGNVLVNEINTLPGFTSASMYPKLWEASGISYSDLLDKLIELALDTKKLKDGLRRSVTQVI